MEILIFSFVQFLCLALGVMISMLIDEIKKQKPHKQRRSTPRRQPPNYTEPNYPPVNKQLQGRLINMVGGDVTTAYRLVRAVMAAYPNQPEAWCWERAIEDLIRDRR